MLGARRLLFGEIGRGESQEFYEIGPKKLKGVGIR